ncbi:MULTISPECIES: winged helix-turn-helix transcriptional regulator [Paenibacillus]|uniref:winged helix-turn-helix transcriptional regulator n=1 Tax=Paenibacillus TaxID=44249 RepID=UPI0022B93C87|nr:helix-turn-helix domain-containing protein [Paenibacillus caseinilyticus]MCZ8520714.1 helix-turn-helix domain-containing protein [Paenibacillus caseinilyticus]
MADVLRKEVKKRLENKEFHCEKELTLSLISGKWKISILYYLNEEGALRFSDLQRLFPRITHKVLTAQLRELEEDGIVARRIYPEVPPRVEYSLTQRGASLLPIIRMMYDWGKEHITHYAKR